MTIIITSLIFKCLPVLVPVYFVVYVYHLMCRHTWLDGPSSESANQWPPVKLPGIDGDPVHSVRTVVSDSVQSNERKNILLNKSFQKKANSSVERYSNGGILHNKDCNKF